MEAKINCEYKKLIPIGDARAHPRNRNKHPAEQIARLAQIIEYQGWRHPIIISNLSGFIVAGHGRLEAAKKLGLKEVPVDFQDFANEEQEYAFLVSDNAAALWAELDFAGINADLPDLGPDFEIDLLGIKGFRLEPAEIEQVVETSKSDYTSPEQAETIKIQVYFDPEEFQAQVAPKIKKLTEEHGFTDISALFKYCLEHAE